MAASSLSGEVDTATHLINSLHLIHTTLTVFEFVDDQLEMLQVRLFQDGGDFHCLWALLASMFNTCHYPLIRHKSRLT